MNASEFLVQNIHSEKEFLELRPHWDQLLSESSYDPLNLTHAWLYCAWQHYKQFDATAQISVFLLCDKGHRVVAILPLMVSMIRFKKIMKVRQLSFLCNDFNEYCGLIIKRGFEEPVVRFLFEVMLKDRARLKWDVLMFKNIAETNPQFAWMVASLKRLNMKCEIKEKTKYYFVDTQRGDFDTYLKSRSAKLKDNLNTGANRLKRYFESAPGQPEVVEKDAFDEKKLEILAAMNRNRQSHKHRKTLLENPHFANFMSDFCLKFRDKVQLFSLKMNGTLVAYSINLIHNNTVMYWSPSFDQRFEKASPGQLLLRSLVETCFREKSRCLDFLRGDSDYKAKWATGYVRGFQIRTFNTSKVLFNILDRMKRAESA